MKLNFKKITAIFTVCSTLLFLGCGGGGTVQQSGENDHTGDKSKNEINSKYKYNRISIAGSSVTWANGMMGNGDYIATVEKYFRQNIAQTLMPNELSSTVQLKLIIDDMSYKRQLYKCPTNTEISGTISGDEISIVFAAERGAENVVVEMIVDGKSLGEKTIISNQILHRNKNFFGDGVIRSFDLGEAHTFNHTVSGYGDGFILQKDYIPAVNFGNYNWAIVRKAVSGPNSAVHHFITFKNPPNGNFSVSYDYGANIKPVKSSVDNIEREIGSPRESVYGDLWKSTTDILAPINGLDFRQNDNNAVKTWKLDNDGNHNFVLKVKSGELILNFITNHMYYFQNAGIGGTSAATLAVATGETGTTQQIIDFDPDLFIFESSTNDAGTVNQYGAEPATSSNNWLAKDISFNKVSSNKIKLNGSTPNIEIGDVVVMGDYMGDITEIAVGVVSNWNPSNNIVTFTEDITNYNSNTCDIKRITKWENNVKKVIDRVVNNINHSIKVGIATCGVPNLDERRLMGYREKGKMLAERNGWMFFDFFEKTIGEDWSSDNAHANTSLGQQLFGEAILEVLFPSEDERK